MTHFSATAAEPLTGITAAPLSLFLLGATGRTGLPFLLQALARGHFVTVYVRTISKLPAAIAVHPRLRVVTGELHEADKITLAVRAATPDVVYVMLASERAPHTAVSTGTHNMLFALRALKATATGEPGATPFISIAAWGLGPTGAYITGLFSRLFVNVATTLFWSKPLADFETQLVEVEAAKDAGLIRPTLILPPILTERAKTNSYLSGEPHLMKDAMGVTNFVSRASIADLCLKLGERAASGEAVPQWVAITNP
ncbi:NAD(P)-dependent oxidoreductase [Sphingomonas sp.]|uniref:NAD(P)-dependent oxidoreductase n=1 Tax=Sphingomonas sp. TaxID=28214 RepID=UPI003D6D8EF3